MKIPAPGYLLDLVRQERRIFFRFAATSLGRTLLSMATIVLIQQFLAGVLGGESGLTSLLADRVGPTAALWGVAYYLIQSDMLSFRET